MRRDSVRVTGHAKFTRGPILARSELWLNAFHRLEKESPRVSYCREKSRDKIEIISAKSKSREGDGRNLLRSRYIWKIFSRSKFSLRFSCLSFLFFHSVRHEWEEGEGKRVCSREQDGTEARRGSTCNLVRYVSLNVELNPGILTFAFFSFFLFLSPPFLINRI